MLVVTFFTLLVLTWPMSPAETVITLSESYWDVDACTDRLEAMSTIVTTLQTAGMTLLDGAACVPASDSTEDTPIDRRP